MIGFVRRGIIAAPAWAALGLWFVWNLWDAFTDAGGGVAYWAHAGGFAFGALAALAMARWGRSWFWIAPATSVSLPVRLRAVGSGE